MSLKSAPYYWLECDDCGEKSTEGGDYTAWSDHGAAESDAEVSDWYVEDGHHWCEACRHKHICIECDKVTDDLDDDTACPECREGGAE